VFQLGILIESHRFRWVHCQLETLRRTLPASIQGALDELPKTLDETYKHALLSIEEEKREYAQRLFKCLTASIRPLLVAEMAEVLAIRFGPGALPKYDAGW
jgi:ankyrin repeat domain-containing protein 50